MNADRSELKRALEAVGAAPVEDVAPRLDDLERRVMAKIAAPPSDDRTEVVVPLAFARRRRIEAARTVVLGAAAACILALVVLAAGWWSDGNGRYVIAAADEVNVVLPDGSSVPGAAGLVVPLGSTIDVDGSMEIDGVTYGPGRYSVTDDGLRDLAESDRSSSTTSTPAIDRGASDGGVGVIVDATTTDPRRPTTGPTTTQRDSTGVDDVRPAPTSTRPPRDRPGDRTTTTLRDRPSTTVVDASPQRAPTTTIPADRQRPTSTIPTSTTTTTTTTPTTTTTSTTIPTSTTITPTTTSTTIPTATTITPTTTTTPPADRPSGDGRDAARRVADD